MSWKLPHQSCLLNEKIGSGVPGVVYKEQFRSGNEDATFVAVKKNAQA
jgi:hypothetical protein